MTCSDKLAFLPRGVQTSVVIIAKHGKMGSNPSYKGQVCKQRTCKVYTSLRLAQGQLEGYTRTSLGSLSPDPRLIPTVLSIEKNLV